MTRTKPSSNSHHLQYFPRCLPQCLALENVSQILAGKTFDFTHTHTKLSRCFLSAPSEKREDLEILVPRDKTFLLILSLPLSTKDPLPHLNSGIHPLSPSLNPRPIVYFSPPNLESYPLYQKLPRSIRICSTLSHLKSAKKCPPSPACTFAFQVAFTCFSSSKLNTLTLWGQPLYLLIWHPNLDHLFVWAWLFLCNSSQTCISTSCLHLDSTWVSQKQTCPNGMISLPHLLPTCSSSSAL